MADNIPWLKQVQSAPRRFRSGMEISYATDGKIFVDFESDDFKPWRETMCPHYAEYSDYDTGETYWEKFSRIPRQVKLYTADTIIRHNPDGTYEYIKNRKTGELRQLTEKEVMWILLHV